MACERPGRGDLGKPTGSPDKLERAAFPQFWPFPASPWRRAVNQKDKEFVAGLFGSPNRTRTEGLLVNRLSYQAERRPFGYHGERNGESRWGQGSPSATSSSGWRRDKTWNWLSVGLP